MKSVAGFPHTNFSPPPVRLTIQRVCVTSRPASRQARSRVWNPNTIWILLNGCAVVTSPDKANEPLEALHCRKAPACVHECVRAWDWSNNISESDKGRGTLLVAQTTQCLLVISTTRLSDVKE